MTKELAEKIFNIVFIVIFVVMAAIMIKGYFDQKKDDEQQISRYENMKPAEGKATLTEQILEEDHDKYIRDIAEGNSTFLKLIICFGTVMLSFVVRAVLDMVLRGISGERGPAFAVAVISAISVIAIFAVVALFAVNRLIPGFNTKDLEEEAYSFDAIELIDSDKIVEYVETSNGDSTTTEERITYFLIEESGNRIEVDHILYERYEGPGVYYAGRTSGGNIFSLYPGKYFELEK